MQTLNLDPQLEKELTLASSESGVTISELITQLIQKKQDEQDINDAEQALKENGGITLQALKKKYAL